MSASASADSRGSGPAARALITAVRVYQHTLAWFLGGGCRFVPSCSEYAVLALERYGAVGGLRRAVGRLLRCHPFHPGGVDFP